MRRPAPSWLPQGQGLPRHALRRFKAETNADAGTILVIPKAEVSPAMLKALLIDEWPIWSAKTGGW